MRAKPHTYHSANYPPLPDTRPLEHWRHPQGVAFVHDLMDGPLPDAYDAADILYMEPPWRSGFAEFNRRAHLDDGRTYPDLMAAIAKLIRDDPRPAVVVTGIHARRMLPPADHKVPILLNEHEAIAYQYRMPRADGAGTLFFTARHLLADLATHYQCIGDPCAGVGASAETFTRANRTFVTSDYNPQCIGHLAQRGETWMPADPDPTTCEGPNV